MTTKDPTKFAVPILFRMRRPDGTVLSENLISSATPWLSLSYQEAVELESDTIVEYRLPEGEWLPARQTRPYVWLAPIGEDE